MAARQNVPLRELTTMKIGGNADLVITVATTEELVHAVDRLQGPYRVLGGGTNLIGCDEGFQGTIIVNRICGLTTTPSEDPSSVIVVAGAGEYLDDVVSSTVNNDLSGIERLSGIPGTIGAAPIQNTGAYGQEIADVLVDLEALDTLLGGLVTLTREQCLFGYRDSIFKHNHHRYIITAVRLQLKRELPQPPFYRSLQTYLDAGGWNARNCTPSVVRRGVLECRRRALPSPELVPNAGSFFKNPVVNATKFDELVSKCPDLPSFETTMGQHKIYAGWLIEQVRFQWENCDSEGVLGGLKTWEANALIIVNSAGADYEHLRRLRARIVDSVWDRFGVCLEQEPEEF